MFLIVINKVLSDRFTIFCNQLEVSWYEKHDRKDSKYPAKKVWWFYVLKFSVASCFIKYIRYVCM